MIWKAQVEKVYITWWSNREVCLMDRPEKQGWFLSKRCTIFPKYKIFIAANFGNTLSGTKANRSLHFTSCFTWWNNENLVLRSWTTQIFFCSSSSFFSFQANFLISFQSAIFWRVYSDALNFSTLEQSEQKFCSTFTTSRPKTNTSGEKKIKMLTRSWKI